MPPEDNVEFHLIGIGFGVDIWVAASGSGLVCFSVNMYASLSLENNLWLLLFVIPGKSQLAQPEVIDEPTVAWLG